MTTQQTEALRLAELLEWDNTHDLRVQAAIELRRLHEEVQEQCRINGMGAERELKLMTEKQELLEALKLYVTQDSFATDYGYGVGGEAKATAEAAIAKAEGETK